MFCYGKPTFRRILQPEAEQDANALFGPPAKRLIHPFADSAAEPQSQPLSAAVPSHQTAAKARHALPGLRNAPQARAQMQHASDTSSASDDDYSSKSSISSKNRAGNKSARAIEAKNSPSKLRKRRKKSPLHGSMSKTPRKAKTDTKRQKKEAACTVLDLDNPEYKKFLEEMEAIKNYKLNIEDEVDYLEKTSTVAAKEEKITLESKVDGLRRSGVRLRDKRRPTEPKGERTTVEPSFKRPESPAQEFSAIQTQHKPKARLRYKTNSAFDIPDNSAEVRPDDTTTNPLGASTIANTTTIHVDPSTRYSVPHSILIRRRSTRPQKNKQERSVRFSPSIVDQQGPQHSTPTNAGKSKRFSVDISPVVSTTEKPKSFAKLGRNLRSEFIDVAEERTHDDVSVAPSKSKDVGISEADAITPFDGGMAPAPDLEIEDDVFTGNDQDELDPTVIASSQGFEVEPELSEKPDSPKRSLSPIVAESDSIRVQGMNDDDEWEPETSPPEVVRAPSSVLAQSVKSIRLSNWRKPGPLAQSTPSHSPVGSLRSLRSRTISLHSETPVTPSSSTACSPGAVLPNPLVTPPPYVRRQTSYIPIFSPAVTASQEDIYARSDLGSSRRQSIVTGAAKKTALQLILEVTKDKRTIGTDAILEPDYRDLVKLGEGSYADVYSARRGRKGEEVVLKIIPVDGVYVSGEKQTSMSEILSEVIISRKLTQMLSEGNQRWYAPVFAKTYFVKIACGPYPDEFSSRHDSFSRSHPEDCLNQHPSFYPDDQRFVIIGLNNGGQALENFPLLSFDSALSVFMQVTLGLAIAEEALEFEHRDLHISNILIRLTNQKELSFYRDGVEYRVQCHGVHVTIIDWTLSRMKDDNGRVIYKDLQDDDRIFQGSGDEQFDVYRFMREENNNDWAAFVPKSNIHWLKYLQNKLLKEKNISSDKGKNDPAKKMLQKILPARHLLKKYTSVAYLVDNAHLFIDCQIEEG